MMKWSLARGIGSDCLQVVVIDHAHAAALHLLEEAPGLDRAHEEHHFEGLDVRAGRDHVDGDGDAWHGAGAELGDQILRLSAGGLVGDLLAEVIAFCELLAHDLYDIFGMGVVLGKDKRLGHPGPAREDLGQYFIAIGPDHGAYLVRRNNCPVELVRIVGQVLVEPLPPHGPGLAVALVHVKARLDLSASLGDRGLDAVDVVVHVHAIGNRLLMAVLHHEILMEEPEGLLVRRGSQADDRGVEVFEHLAPEVVDGAVAFVGHDDVEGLDGYGGLVMRDDPLFRAEHILP